MVIQTPAATDIEVGIAIATSCNREPCWWGHVVCVGRLQWQGNRPQISKCKPNWRRLRANKKTCRNYLIIRILSNATPCGCQVPLQGSQQVSTCSHAVTLDFVMACFFDILGNNMCFSFYMFKTSSHGHPAANIKISKTYFLYAYSHVLFWLRKHNKNYNF